MTKSEAGMTRKKTLDLARVVFPQSPILRSITATMDDNNLAAQ